MKEINWQQAFNLATAYNVLEKVTLFMFTDPQCEVCNEFVPTLKDLENEDYQVFVVTDGHDMPFTLTSYPMGYVYIPNCPTKMPMQRIGNAPLDVMLDDAKVQIEAMKTGRAYEEVRNAYRENRSTEAA